ncbi:MAG: Pyridoxal-5-phosphate-dependent protein beta subunit [Myxococcales bacterium]|nr:Pyridoxal-5-phosphate-dependent protein beta subunit [Myxococcales bacterium]
MSASVEPPDFDFVRKTPLVFAPPLNCWLKLESLQATGSFKLRGAALKMSRLAAGERARGVVTASAGNHGQGLALAATRLGVPATVVVPRLCPAVKRDAIARYGAEVIVDGANYVAAEKRAMALAKERGVPYVSPFDDDDVIAGNGEWLGREIRAQHAALSRVIAPVGGGGLVSGLLRALDGVEVVGVQPRTNCAMHDSLAQDRALVDYEGGETLCEGLEGAISERTFAVARAHGLTVALVDEDEVLGAIGFAYRALGLVIEPSAAVGIAAARAQRVATDEETVIVVTGANVEPALLERAIAFNDRSGTPRR